MADSTFKINWHVDDGFIGNGSHSFNVRLSDFEEDMGVPEIIEELEQFIQRRFEDKVRWISPNHEKVAGEIHAALQNKAQEED